MTRRWIKTDLIRKGEYMVDDPESMAYQAITWGEGIRKGWVLVFVDRTSKRRDWVAWVWDKKEREFQKKKLYTKDIKEAMAKALLFL